MKNIMAKRAKHERKPDTIAHYGSARIYRYHGAFHVETEDGAGDAYFALWAQGAGRAELRAAMPRPLRKFFQASRDAAARVRAGADPEAYANMMEEIVQEDERGKPKLRFTAKGRRSAGACACLRAAEEEA